MTSGFGRGQVGVAISTTGDEHRLGFLETALLRWSDAVPDDSPIFVTVDGDCDDTARVVHSVARLCAQSPQVCHIEVYQVTPLSGRRQGVAVNKNTGLELLMGSNARHLFLSDDDTWPMRPEAVRMHSEGGLHHSLLNWGEHRLTGIEWSGSTEYAAWKWPRGQMLYLHRRVVGLVGGMVEVYGPMGHEHVEFSRRIHQAGLSPVAYVSPVEYARPDANGAALFWHAEDMPRPGEPKHATFYRRREHTSMRREMTSWSTVEAVLAKHDGDTNYKPYTAAENARPSATLAWT